MSYISEFTTDLHHIQGKNNVVADALSHVQLNEILTTSTTTIDYEAMAKAQKAGKETHALYTAITSLFSTKIFQLSQVNHSYVTSLFSGYSQSLRHLFGGWSWISYTMCHIQEFIQLTN